MLGHDPVLPRQGFDHGVHAKGRRMQQTVMIQHQPDMAAPKDQITSTKILARNLLREKAFANPVSRGALMPAPAKVICTKPEQSMPRLGVPIHRVHPETALGIPWANRS